MNRFILLIFISLLFGCKTPNNMTEKNNLSKDNLNYKIEENKNPREILEFQKKDNFSKNEKIGQLICVGINGTEIDDELKSFIDKYKPGSFILFKRNIKNSTQLKKMNNSLKEYYNEKNYIYPFIFVDQEGGKVDRLKSVYEKMNSANWYYNNSNAKDYAKDLNLRMNEFNFDSPLCPVLDVNDAKSKGAIGDRSFTNDYKKVSDFTKGLLIEFNKTNMISVAKHFPGHGATEVDSHYDLPIINKTYEDLKHSDMLPFIDNIKSLDAIMIAHILVPDVDKLPASLSCKWINILRNIGFKGLILSDDLTMDALNNYGDINKRFINFIKAGGDIGLLCHNINNLDTIFNELKSINDKRIDESFERIMSFKNEKIKNK